MYFVIVLLHVICILFFDNLRLEVLRSVVFVGEWV